MKQLLFALILLSNISHAQNYQCLQSDVKRYFTNGNGYIRGIRIDSVKTAGDTTIYYPFHSRRGNNDGPDPLDSNGASWLGKEVLQLADGTFLFDNMWHTAVTIKPQAHTGDSWIFFADTSTHYYIARVTSESVATLPGGIDSVKTVTIYAYDTMGLATSDSLNGFTFKLSKNHGFATIFDLYTFPYRALPSHFLVGYLDYTYDYLLWQITSSYSEPSPARHPNPKNSIFSVVSLINPTYQQLYDWHPGDVFENKIFNGAASNGLYPPGYYFDSIIDRTELADRTIYTISGWRATMHYPWYVLVTGTINPDFPYPYDTSSVSGTFSISNSLMIDTAMMPEEKNQPWFIYYTPNDSNEALPSILYSVPTDTINCVISDRFRFVQTRMPGDHYYIYFEGVPINREYKTGLGLIQYHWDNLGGSPLIVDTTLIYYVKGGETCGHYTPPHPIYDVTKVNQPQKTDYINIYPNPTSFQLTIKSTNQPINEIAITTPLGQTVYSQHQDTSGTMVQIDVSNLPTGIYFIRINGADVRKFVKE